LIFSLFIKNFVKIKNNMNKKLTIILVIILTTFFIACDKKQNAGGNTNSAGNTEIKKGVTPVADDEIAVIEMENAAAFGTIKIELYSNIAPKMVARFKELAKEGFYNGTTFHRINQSVIQGGDPNSKDNDPGNDGQGGSDKENVPAEFSDIPFDAGFVGAARGQDENSANSQFFITLKREPGFDNRYTIFGKVIEGMNNVGTISGVVPKQGERPLDDVKIKSITIQPKQ
jgi:cyclophilin family peptidyl-prolyl cis-trans isomerase